MATKSNGLMAPDGSHYVTVTDGNGNTAGASYPFITTATLTSVASANADTQLLAANANRKPGSVIVNESTSILYIKLGTGASASSYIAVVPATATSISTGYAIPAGYTGVVNGFWVSANGFARITEMA